MLNPRPEFLATLRATIGYLGEREQFAWWQSSFFDPDSGAFLAPVFARTQALARCSGVTQAAALIHDERIGAGDVYHLFRLPEALEQAIHRALLLPALAERIAGVTSGRESALSCVAAEGPPAQKAKPGPVRVGTLADLHLGASWSTVAGMYARAFQANAQVFPYFADRAL